MDRRTRIPARLYLDDDNRVWLEFNDSGAAEILTRRIGFSGEQKPQQSR